MIFEDSNITKDFYSDLSGKPIEHCSLCSKHLLDPHQIYFIQKVIKDSQVEFEYAICLECSMEMKSEMSEESMRNMENYVNSSAIIQENRMKMMQEETLRVEDFLKKCSIKGTPIYDLAEYQLVGAFQGLHFYEGGMPFLVGIDALEELDDLMSAKTKGEMDKYLDDLTSLPPDWREWFRTKKPILI